MPQAKYILSLAGKGGVQALTCGQGHIAAHRLKVESWHHLIASDVVMHWEEGRYVVVIVAVVVGG